MTEPSDERDDQADELERDDQAAERTEILPGQHKYPSDGDGVIVDPNGERFAVG